jgi:adenylate kinase
MMEEILVKQPSDPIQCLIEFLSRDDSSVAQVIVCGPPVSGKKTIGRRIAQKLQCIYVDPFAVLRSEDSQVATKIKNALEANKVVPSSLWAELISIRLKQVDCLNKGWVLAGFPNTREEALLLQASGVMAHHFVQLEATDSVLIERSVGKRVDHITGDVYHITFVPPGPSVSERLVSVEGGQERVVQRLREYHRHSEGVLSCYRYCSKQFDADQPLDDLFSQVARFLCKVSRGNAPLIPRVVIIGPPGSGKTTVATQLSKKYNLVNVDCKELMSQTLQSSSRMATLMMPFHEKGMLIPDDIAMEVVAGRLKQLDSSTRGWVLHGFPLNREQAKLLDNFGLQPNRVYFLDAPMDSLLERVTLRYVDPMTGKRYHLFYNPPPNQEIKDRLKQNPKDSEDRLKKKVEQYQMLLDDLVAYYTRGLHINADQDPQTVFECIETSLVNPLSKVL